MAKVFNETGAPKRSEALPYDEARALDNGTEMIESLATRRYVTGIGWCWMEDGEIIEIIST